MFAGKNYLNNLLVIVDKNDLSVMDVIKESSDSNLSSKFKAYDWNVKQIDGHSFTQILSSLKFDPNVKKPTVIIANTVKGKGISFMENEITWHSGIPTKEQFNKAIKEVSN